jgi:hypothetical protein
MVYGKVGETAKKKTADTYNQKTESTESIASG